MTNVSISEALLNQVQILARQLDISRDDLIKIAIEQFIKLQPKENPAIINQGDVYWMSPESLNDLEASVPHPIVVIQENVLNHSRIDTVVVCALTSNLKRVNLPGNVLLEIDEANLSRQSVVEVAKVSSIAKSQLGDYIGTLSERRIKQIFAGMRFLQRSFG